MLDIIKAYKSIFETPNGEKVLENLQEAHYINGPLVNTTGAIDPLKLAMAEGERNVVLRIMTILNQKENEYVPGRYIDTNTDAE